MVLRSDLTNRGKNLRALLINPGCPRTFWSFNRVLCMLDKAALTIPLGLITLAALLPEDWDVKLADESVREITEVDWAGSDIVMISGMVTQSEGLVKAIHEAKQRDKLVVVGGPWAFHLPEEAFGAGADIVVKGEAECVIPRLLEAIRKGEKNLIIEGAGRPDLKDSPIPRFDLLEKDRYINMAVQFSRGCPFRCEFCDITLMFGRQVRTKSSRQFIKELDALYEAGWRGGVFVVDDNFVANVSRCKALLRLLGEWMDDRGHPFEFFTQASVNLAADSELMELMVRAGFNKVFLGIESVDEASLLEAKKFQNVRADLDSVCDKINTAGLQIIGGCILGFDNEAPGAEQRLIDFAMRNHIPEVFVTLLQVGPGTDLWYRLEQQGRIVEIPNFGENCGNNAGAMNFVPTRPVKQILSEFIRIYDVLYEPACYLERSFRHVAKMRPPKVKKSFTFPGATELRAVAIAIYRHGFVYSAKWRFWRLFLSAMFKFPSRMDLFLTYCVMGEHFYEYRKDIKAQIQPQLALGDLAAPKQPMSQTTELEKTHIVS